MPSILFIWASLFSFLGFRLLAYVRQLIIDALVYSLILHSLYCGSLSCVNYSDTHKMKTTDTALLGHVSREALSAAALSDLWTMCTQVLINGKILSVLVGGAVGAGNPKLAGIYLQVSLAVLCPLAVFVFVAWSFTDLVWILFGSDPEVSQMAAGYYATVLAFAIPGTLGFGQLSQFFSAQRIMRPAGSELFVLGTRYESCVGTDLGSRCWNSPL
jgi:hypothetical protein